LWCSIRNATFRSFAWLVPLLMVASGWAFAQTAHAAATSVVVSLSPTSIAANGTSTTLATATVTDATPPTAGDTVVFSSSDTAQTKISATTFTTPNIYTATITSTTTVGTPTITATDTSVTPNVSGTATLTQTGPAASVTLQLAPSSIVANGTSATTATARVTDSQAHPLPAETVVFTSSDPGQKISATTNAGNGTYTTTITSSTTVATPTITATDGTVSTTQGLTQTVGFPATVTVHLNPSSIIADGVSIAAATATVTDLQGHAIPTDTVAFASTDPGQFIGQVSNHQNGTYSVQIRSSTTPGRDTITATDAANMTGQATLVQFASPSSTTLLASKTALVTNETVTLFAAVSSAIGSPSGTITFNNNGVPISRCQRMSITPSSAAATCQTSFAASTSTKQINAAFTPDPTSVVPGSSAAVTVTVKPDSSSVSLDVAAKVPVGQRTTYISVVRPPTSRPGPVMPSGSVEFIDRGKPILSCLRQAVVNGRATCTVTHRALGTHRITAQYSGDPNFEGSASAARAVSVVLAPLRVLGVVTATMQWTFHYTPVYTKIVALVVNGASASDTVAVTCHGRGCPFARHATAVAKPKRCGQTGQRACPTSGTINLAPAFQNHRLSIGTKLTIMITRPERMGKYYAFTIQARRGPGIQITCLAPGSTRPGGRCSQ
jgi:hypothetical protein